MWDESVGTFPALHRDEASADEGNGVSAGREALCRAVHPQRGAVSTEHLPGVGQLAALQHEEAVAADELVGASLRPGLAFHGQLLPSDGSQLRRLVDDQRLGLLVVGEHLELLGLELVERLVRLLVALAFDVAVVFLVDQDYFDGDVELLVELFEILLDVGLAVEVLVAPLAVGGLGDVLDIPVAGQNLEVVVVSVGHAGLRLPDAAPEYIGRCPAGNRPPVWVVPGRRREPQPVRSRSRSPRGER